MIKDAHLRIIFIPVLGISLPLISGTISYNLYTVPELVFINLFFILVSMSIWYGSSWMHAKIRGLFLPQFNPLTKLATIVFSEGLYGACVGGVAILLWMKLSRETFDWNSILLFAVLCVLAVVIFSLTYEILYLSKERELDDRRVRKLRRERSQAELHALSRELDPHFIFNSLNALNHLIVNNQDLAYQFNNKLAQVYKYFLINRNRDLISLEEELEFMENYFFLLQIRHDNKLQLHACLGEDQKKTLVPPCALQILLENAIKHNEFNDNNPLQVKIAMNGHYLNISNNVKPKLYAVSSTGIGLKNLSSRYKILCQKDIVIERSPENFLVKLPLIK